MIFVLILFLLALPIPGEELEETSGDNGDLCFPVIEISRTGFYTRSFCLNEYAPPVDSCRDFTISFPLTGVGIVFHCGPDRIWSYKGIGHKGEESAVIPVRVNISDDGNGVLLSAGIIIDSIPDSSFFFKPQIINDQPVLPDTAQPLDYSINLSTFLCKPKPVVTERKFKYPAGYRRDPILNYPELAMFHYGSGIRMPSSVSIRDRGVMIFEYHILHPGKLEYEDLEKIAKKEAWIRKYDGIKASEPVKKEKKPGFLKFKPLQGRSRGF